jgi:NAD(P)-dependent dehydrogenase (short-subunit alcohol dehydrogenase family)
MRIDDAKHAFITGGASGIGLAIAQALGAKGVKVTVADVNGDALAAAIGANETNLRGVVLDVRDRAAWATAKVEVEQAFGPVDLLFNNAGIASLGYDLADLDPDAFDRVVGINLTGVFNGISTFAAGMRERGRGHIVNTSSMAGICGPAQGIGGSYAAAKFGVVGLSETLRGELAPYGVGVSILCPGQTTTAIVQSSLALGGGFRMPTGSPAAGSPAKSSPRFETGTAEELAMLVLRGIEQNSLYIITRGRGWWQLAHARHQVVEHAFEGMKEPL